MFKLFGAIMVLYLMLFPSKEIKKESLYHMCLLTSQRPKSYIKESLNSLRREGFGSITIIDTDGSYGSLPNMSSYRKIADCIDDGLDVLSGLPCKVEQSNYDVAMALWVCDLHANNAKWIIFIEDDMEACQNSLRDVKSALLDSDDNVIQFSKFSRAFAVRRGRAVLELFSSIRCHASTTPYDIVLWNTFPHHTKTLNLFHHMGVVSTIAYRNTENYLQQYAQMRSDVCGVHF